MATNPNDAQPPLIKGVEMLWQPASPETVSPASPERSTREQTPDDIQASGQAIGHEQAAKQDSGDVTPTPASEPAESESPAHARDVDIQGITNRFLSEGRWKGQVEGVRDQMMKDARKRIPNKTARQQWVYAELDRMYPPEKRPPMVDTKFIGAGPDAIPGNVPGEKSDDGAIQGLATIPKTWPELPANASLSAEIGWVQANRLRIVTEQLGRATKVDLAKALSPAPSWAALGWLETSIRSYAKFVDVAAKASGADDGENAALRRERMSIDEVRSLLAEMEDAG